MSSYKFLMNTIIVLIINLQFNRVSSEFNSSDPKLIENLILSKDKFIKSNSSLVLKQLNCHNDTEKLCTKEYELEKVTCENLNFEVNSTGKWLCDEAEFKKVNFKSYEIFCEPYKNSSTLIIDGSCYLNYTLRYPYIDNSTGVIELEAIAIAIFVILCLIVCVAAGFLFKQEDHLLCIKPELRKGSSLNTISGSLGILREDSTEMTVTTYSSNYGTASNHSFKI